MYLLSIFISFLNFLFLFFFGKFFGRKYSGYLVVIGMSLSFFISIFIFFEVCLSGHVCYIILGEWIYSDIFLVNFGFLFDVITSIMLLIVSFVALLVHIYSLGYMEKDPHLIRFLSYLSLFTFFMCVLVTANNFLQMFFGWEGVGLASYLLINFWFTRISANVAAIKAMIVNRIGDCGLLLGILCIFSTFYSLDYTVVFPLVHKIINNSMLFLNMDFNIMTLICLLLFVGVVGKSAQLGLHTWLPDAMEGPTPVSALIHAATMVTAGIFILIRCSPMFEYSNNMLTIIIFFGALTALLGSLVALGQTDLKKIIAYSTCSQLGYMVVACGLSQYHVGLFHLANHAIFKALLFLSAGAIIHALMDEQNLNRMGKLAALFPLLYVFIFIGSLSLAGLPFLTGFYSKHFIMELSSTYYIISGDFVCVLLYLSAFFTNLYSLKLIYKAFFLHNLSFKLYFKEIYHLSYYIVVVLIILAIGSIYFGYLLNDCFIGVSTFFFGNSIFVLEDNLINMELEFSPHYVKFFPIMLNFVSLLLVSLYYNGYLYNKISKFIWYYLLNAMLFNIFYNNFIVKIFLSFCFLIAKFYDRGFLQIIGPKGLSSFFLFLSELLSKIQTGLIYHYVIFIIFGILSFIGVFFFIEYVMLVICLFLLFLLIVLYLISFVMLGYIIKNYYFRKFL